MLVRTGICHPNPASLVIVWLIAIETMTNHARSLKPQVGRQDPGKFFFLKNLLKN